MSNAGLLLLRVYGLGFKVLSRVSSKKVNRENSHPVLGNQMETGYIVVVIDIRVSKDQRCVLRASYTEECSILLLWKPAHRPSYFQARKGQHLQRTQGCLYGCCLGASLIEFIK